jgi:hypothetical protein
MLDGSGYIGGIVRLRREAERFEKIQAFEMRDSSC